MDFRDVTPARWKEIEAYVMAAHQPAFRLCDELCQEDFEIDDPLMHAAGAMLGAICDLRRLVGHVQDGHTINPVPRGEAKSLLMWVKPHAGGGVSPRKR